MTSQIDICNRALAVAGTRSTIDSFDEGTAESIQAALWYDTTRQELLRAAPWSFARATGVLSQLGSAQAGMSQYPWPYMYAYPVDCMKARYVLGPTPVAGGDQPLWCDSGPSRANKFLIGSALVGVPPQRVRVLLSNRDQAQLVYTADIQDVGMFDPLFQGALVQLLASRFAIPLSGNVGMRAQFLQSANDAVTVARAADGNEAMTSTDHVPDWISARMVGGFEASGDFPYGTWYSGFDNVSWGD